MKRTRVWDWTGLFEIKISGRVEIQRGKHKGKIGTVVSFHRGEFDGKIRVLIAVDKDTYVQLAPTSLEVAR